jgi:hypothetical protein
MIAVVALEPLGAGQSVPLSGRLDVTADSVARGPVRVSTRTRGHRFDNTAAADYLCIVPLLVMFSLLLALPGDSAAAPAARSTMLGRCPPGDYTAIVAGRFITQESDAVVLRQSLGSTTLSDTRTGRPALVNLFRLTLAAPSPAGIRTVWQSPPFAEVPTGSNLSGTAWTTGDADGNGWDELLLFSLDTCRVLSFAHDTVVVTRFPMPGRIVDGAAVCDLDADSIPDLLLLERSALAPESTARLLSACQLTSSGLAPKSAGTVGLDWGSRNRILLLGSAVLEDYPGRPAILAGIDTSPAPRPGTYAAVYQRATDSLVLAFGPFPWSEWFDKKRALPAGELSVYDVGDTLLAYGYFVPGARPFGSPSSFAALQDGEWRVLAFADDAHPVTGPACRFRWNGAAGWVELRGDVLLFRAGDPFRWR